MDCASLCDIHRRRLDVAEMEGFEPPHTLRRLPDFESGPFNHLGTSPYNIEIISNCVLHGSLKGTCQLPPLFQGNARLLWTSVFYYATFFPGMQGPAFSLQKKFPSSAASGAGEWHRLPQTVWERSRCLCGQ